MTAQRGRLGQLFLSPKLEFMMEAHNALTARIVEEAGFKAIWASGLSISAQLGVRDCNEASWTQILDVVEFMSDAVTVPILLDGDTGYGNFNNVRRLVRKLEQRRIAGVCLEDKLFPKTNSFIEGARQPLATIEEFTGKIKAGKDSQSSSDFAIVARVEALIAGWPMAEALLRAEAYRRAGADAILIHSKESDASEIETFMREWGGRHPIVIVPTKYYLTETTHFRELGVSAVIWANHCLRASIASVKSIASRIFAAESVAGVETDIASLAEVFRLQRYSELTQAERVYLPSDKSSDTPTGLTALVGASIGETAPGVPRAN